MGGKKYEIKGLTVSRWLVVSDRSKWQVVLKPFHLTLITQVGPNWLFSEGQLQQIKMANTVIVFYLLVLDEIADFQPSDLQTSRWTVSRSRATTSPHCGSCAWSQWRTSSSSSTSPQTSSSTAASVVSSKLLSLNFALFSAKKFRLKVKLPTPTLINIQKERKGGRNNSSFL